MKNKIIKIQCFVVILFLFSFCQNHKKDQPNVHPKDFGINISAGGGLTGPYFTAKIFTPGLLDHRRKGFDVNALYILKYYHGGEPDTFKIQLNKNEIDSLYSLTYEYLSTSYKSVQVRDENMRVNDGPSIVVQIIYAKKELTCQEWDIESISSPSVEAARLFRFINKRVSKDFKLY
jgi:hypothetical protein